MVAMETAAVEVVAEMTGPIIMPKKDKCPADRPMAIIMSVTFDMPNAVTSSWHVKLALPRAIEAIPGV